MKKLNYLLVGLFLLAFTTSGISQADSLYQEYLKEIDIPSVHVNYFPVEYENTVDLVFYFNSKTERTPNYKVSISSQSTLVDEVSPSNAEEYFVIENLPKNSVYDINIKSIENGKITNYASNLSTVSTHTDDYIIHLSDGLYNAIADWGATEYQAQPLQDFILDLEDDQNVYELAYFLQNHYDVPNLTKPSRQDITVVDFFPNWPPTRDDGDDGTGPNNDGSGPRNDCNCSFTQNSNSDPDPGEKVENGLITEKVIVNYAGNPEDTRYSLVGKGAAKRMTLSMKGKHGIGKYEASTTGVGTDAPEVSPFNSRISYNFVCTENGNDLPEACECPKDIWVEYSYTTRINTKVDKGGGWWIWSAGGEAVAEDHAVLIIQNGEDVSIADAGRARSATHCESNWNTEWWTNAAELVANTVGVAIDTNSTPVSWVELADDVVNVLSTSFYNAEGDCTDKNQVGTLIAGKRKVEMTANNPIDIILSSYGYEFVRGYGKWDNRADMVSDYSLSTILLGEDDEESGCCSHKIANYMTGSFEDVIFMLWGIYPIVVAEGSVNNQKDLLDDVSSHFRLWAPFDDLERDFKGDFILNGEWGQIIQISPNCSTPIDLQNEENELSYRSIDEVGNIYPNPTSDILNIDLAYDTGYIYNSSGILVKKLLNAESIDLSDLKIGNYVLNLISGSDSNYYKFIKVR